jgi:hypothetical protein
MQKECKIIFAIIYAFLFNILVVQFNQSEQQLPEDMLNNECLPSSNSMVIINSVFREYKFEHFIAN